MISISLVSERHNDKLSLHNKGLGSGSLLVASYI